MQRFSNRTFIVTGAGSGIGRAAAQRLASEAAKVVCVDLHEAALEEVVAEITGTGGDACAVACDISDEVAVNELVADCVARHGALHGLVNMAGMLRFDATDEINTEDWARVIAVNLTGAMLLCRAVLPELVKTRGNIVNAASTAALSGLPCGAIYSASKGGVLAMTRSIAVEYAKRGVRANCVCPGDIKSNMTQGIAFPEAMDFDLMPRIMSLTGATEADAVAGVIAMLASDDGRHITGEHIRVDGGTLS